MKSLKLLIFAALAILFFACSSPAGSDANSTTVTNGGSSQTTQGGGSQSNQKSNECDMGGDFDLNAYEYYVLGEKKHYTYSASFDKITWQNEITIESQTISDIGLEFKKQGNFLIVEKRSASNSYRIDISEVKKNGNRIDITLILAN